jgi:N-carbamoyl-L-amino-acid hydrolase
MKNIQIDSDRLWLSLMKMAKIGATKKGGNCRLALTDLDAECRNLFIKWCEDAGCTVSVDGVGNIFARRVGRDDSLPPIVFGSHLDTQPTGGRFDGVLGVMAGLEVMRTLNDNALETNAPIEVVNWTNEEGSRYSPAMMGSGVFAGIFDQAEVMAKEDGDGKSFGDELERTGFAGTAPVGGRDIGAYFELHIEQGPILEAEEKTIGVVTDAQGQRWYELNITGQESHAGPTPMPIRKDALVTASKIIQKVNSIGHAHPPFACATVGQIISSPNSRNVIPGHVFLTIDFRHPNSNVLMEMDKELKAFCTQIESEDHVEIEVIDFWQFAPTPFDKACVEAVREGAQISNYAHRDICSGAGHDAVQMASIAPSAMIFIPCEDGISHNEVENASPEDCAAGTNVLLHAVLSHAGTAD